MADTVANLVSLLSDLVAFPSESSKLADCDRCFDYLESYLTERGLVVARHNSNGLPSIVASTRETMAPKVLLQAHMDVVPAGEDSYKMVEKDGKLYGRGVYDMKFAAACYLQLVEDLQNELQTYDFGIMLTCDEEIGGEDGVAMLLNRGYGGQVCILPDGGDNLHLEVSSSGVWQINLFAQGQNAHASRPWEGENAISRLMDSLEEISQVFEPAELGKSTGVITMISGGQATNQVPGEAEASIDMRFMTDEEQDYVRGKIEKIVQKYDLRLETIAQCDAGKLEVEHPEIESFLTVAEQVYGKPVGQTHSLGSSDARFFSAHNIPTVLIRPHGGGAHSDNEWIDKQEFIKFYDLIKTYVTSAAKIS